MNYELFHRNIITKIINQLSFKVHFYFMFVIKIKTLTYLGHFIVIHFNSIHITNN